MLPRCRLLLVLAALAFCRPAWAGDPPNVVLVMADDQGWGDMAYNGHPHLETPHFDALAREGVRFDHFHAAAPVCSPTRGSVLTGRHPNRFACFQWGHPIRPQERTVAQALRRAGSGARGRVQSSIGGSCGRYGVCFGTPPPGWLSGR